MLQASGTREGGEKLKGRILPSGQDDGLVSVRAALAGNKSTQSQEVRPRVEEVE